MANKYTEIMIDLPNIRCVTCGKVIGHLHEQLVELRTKSYTNEEIFEELDLKRPCCRNSMINPPKYSFVGTDEDDPSHPLNQTVEESSISLSRDHDSDHRDKSTGIRNRLIKMKEKEASQARKKPTMCYYAI
jgi:DNA-directed RNA polymerase subunit N (RpoN/RPB10)